MTTIKLFFTITLLGYTFCSWIYSFILLKKYLSKKLSKEDVSRKTFWITFTGWMSMFFAYFIWQNGWVIQSLFFFIIVALIISGIGAFAFIASFLSIKK